MPKFHVRKSILIAAPVERVYASVRDFRQWPVWSPWLICEPDSHMDYAADGKSYAWNGRITGSGEMAVTSEQAPRSINYQLTFLKPWKSVNSAGFQFADRNGTTEVTWTMEGSLPFFMFWMTSMMSAYVGADYQRGLMLLKDYIETGSVRSKLAFTGPQSFPGCRYIGVKTRCPISDLARSMQQDMEKLTGWLGQRELQPAGKPFSICHKWDLVKGTADYTLAFPLAATPTGLPAGFVTAEIPASQVFAIRHTGPYRYLGNAWAAGVMRSRMKIFTPNKIIDPFEVYENDPSVVPEDELVTVLHFPIK